MADGSPRPPPPRGILTPNFLAVEEAVGNVTFPISKRELMDALGDNTVLLGGRNVDLHDLVRDLNDDYFESEDEFRAALEVQYAGLFDAIATDQDLSPLPTATRSGGESGWGPESASGAEEPAGPTP